MIYSIQNPVKHDMEHFAKIVNGLKPLTIFAKRSILDVWHGCEYTFTIYLFKTI